MDYQQLIEERIYAEMHNRDIIYGTIIGTVPSLFLGLYTPLYATAELIAYFFTKRKMLLYAAIVSFIVSIAFYLTFYSTAYRNFMKKETEILPLPKSRSL